YQAITYAGLKTFLHNPGDFNCPAYNWDYELNDPTVGGNQGMRTMHIRINFAVIASNLMPKMAFLTSIIG
ncbi:hypothetical protein MMC19_002275, partial [Ptychographa xylographoides]|nr:hypothetical protein [Ptychographa xylographoides]